MKHGEEQHANSSLQAHLELSQFSAVSEDQKCDLIRLLARASHRNVKDSPCGVICPHVSQARLHTEMGQNNQTVHNVPREWSALN